MRSDSEDDCVGFEEVEVDSVENLPRRSRKEEMVWHDFEMTKLISLLLRLVFILR
jgi:hypothetical protein